MGHSVESKAKGGICGGASADTLSNYIRLIKAEVNRNLTVNLKATGDRPR